MKLGITGIIAALVAGTTPNRNAAWSCALSAAVNAVACVHYWLVWGIRAQSMPTGYEHFASGRTLQGDWTGRKRADDFKQLDRDRMFAQELAVDGLRCFHKLEPVAFAALGLHAPICCTGTRTGL